MNVLFEQVIAGSIFEVFWAWYSHENYGIRVLRALRLLRIFKVTRCALLS